MEPKIKLKPQMWTDSRQEEYAWFLACGKNVYGIKFEKYDRTFPPVNFDYREKFQTEAEKLEASGKNSTHFNIIGDLEYVGIEDGKIKAKFLLPGTLKQIFTIYLDPKKQDIKGKIGLKIKCLMKRVKSIDIEPYVK